MEKMILYNVVLFFLSLFELEANPIIIFPSSLHVFACDMVGCGAVVA